MKLLFTTLFYFVWLLAPAFTQSTSYFGASSSRNEDNLCRKDSTLIFSNSNILEERVLYQYNGNSEIRYRFRRSDPGGALVPFSIDSSFYDNEHRLVYEELNAILFNPANQEQLVYLDRQTFLFPCPGNGTCLTDSVVVFVSQIPFSPLKPSYKSVNYYDTQGRIEKNIIYTPDAGFVDFRPSTKEEYVYDPLNGRLSTIFNFIFSTFNNNWLPSTIEEYTYDATGQLTGILEKEAADGTPQSRSVISVNPALHLEEIQFSYWNLFQNTWNAPITTTRYYRDATERISAQVLKVNALQLQGTDSTHYDYLAGTDCLQFITLYSGAGNFPPSLSQRTIHYYSSTSGTESPDEIAFLAYPNPASDLIILEGTKGAIAQIMSVNGQVVFQQLITSDQETLQLPFLSAGTYFLFVKQNERVGSRKIIVR